MNSIFKAARSLAADPFGLKTLAEVNRSFAKVMREIRSPFAPMRGVVPGFPKAPKLDLGFGLKLRELGRWA